ncbi:flagellar hook protein FlgK [Polymorphobacter glacialis]|uniref:Flagellar hook-associated protein 1 n=1 Tax=Sandarakinorhabdus glacialis TaxID=1614636 RepID=A0A917E5N8_9SPHN|nr:flagellar hook-associated protein FlgK [Polymorphobacter glacialis]GGE02178.1 flagellar hook protein FlgK [Polymorphobacter glacialis]
MTDLLGIGSAGVRAYQAALTIIGDNVANADNPDYVRRQIRMHTSPSGAGTPLERDTATGAGVSAGAITRATDALKVNSARVAAGDHARYEVRADWMVRLETLITGSDLDTRLGGFFDAATDLAAAPTSTAARTIFLDRANQAASSFAGLGKGLDQLGNDLKSAAETGTTEVNAITSALARVNDELRRTQSGGAAANGLLDSRDSLLAELAQRVRISVTEGDRGTVTVKLGSGAAAATLVPANGPAVRIGVRDGPSGAEIILDPTHSAIVLTLPASGSLAGLIEASRQVGETRAELDGLAGRFATDINAWHSAGTDALGDPGTPLFSTQTLVNTPGRANAGDAAIDIRIADNAPLAPDGYRLLKDAAGWTLSRTDGTATVSGTGALTLDGVTIRPGTGARAGDSWTLHPAGGAIGLALRPIGAERLAVAARFITDTAAANKGDGRITLDTDPAAAAFAPAAPYRLTVTAPGIAQITDIATGSVLATVALDGSRIIGAGFGITLTGSPVVGDSFRILQTGPGSSDNGNARALSAVRANSGTGGTMEASLDAGTARIASRLSETRRLAAAALSVRSDSARARDAVSGVDLDREAAELTRLQVAYRANAQVIAAARDLFDTLLGVAS